jgi:isoprenylcysteine carboxyl methyltransferase (ICMT) family protein YpbQ
MDILKLGLFFIVLLNWIAELRIHFRNSRFLQMHGAIPFGVGLYYFYYLIIVLCSVLPLLESRWLPSIVDVSFNIKIFLILIMITSQAMRWYAIDSINKIWTLVGYRHKKLRRWSVGPYRVCNHPELIARFIEAMCIFIIFEGGFVSLSALIVLFPATLFIVQVESEEDSLFSGKREVHYQK